MKNKEQQFQQGEVTFVNKLSDLLKTDDLVGLRSFLKIHPEVTPENYKEEVLLLVESFFIKHLQHPDEEDGLDKLHEVLNLSFCSLDEIKKDKKIVSALLQALEDLRKEQNNNAIGRIENLGILEKDVIRKAA